MCASPGLAQTADDFVQLAAVWIQTWRRITSSQLLSSFPVAVSRPSLFILTLRPGVKIFAADKMWSGVSELSLAYGDRRRMRNNVKA
jgi:hypothetical protein